MSSLRDCAHVLRFKTGERCRPCRIRREAIAGKSPCPRCGRDAVAAFANHMVRSRERARRTGTRPRADNTIEHTLSIIRDLPRFLANERAKHDWSVVEVGDIEMFLRERPANRRRRLQTARQFFG